MANRFDEALVAFRESLRLDPHDPTCLCNCAVTLLEIGQLDEAMASVDAGLAVAPNDADLLQCKGGILYHSGRREESLRFFDASNSSRITARATPELPQSRISISTSLGTLTE